LHVELIKMHLVGGIDLQGLSLLSAMAIMHLEAGPSKFDLVERSGSFWT
jgi:hypothetical protein